MYRNPESAGAPTFIVFKPSKLRHLINRQNHPISLEHNRNYLASISSTFDFHIFNPIIYLHFIIQFLEAWTTMSMLVSMSLAVSISTMWTRMRTIWRGIVRCVRLRTAEVVILLSIVGRILRTAMMLFMMLIMLVAVTLLRYVLRLVVASMLLWRRVRGFVTTPWLVTLV